MSDQELNTDKVYDPDTQRAFDLAVKFYEADQKLNKNDRELLGSLYTKVTYSTLVIGWGAFFAAASIPFYRQKLKTGSRKGTNVGRAFLLGFVGMIFGAPLGSKYTYSWQVDSLQEQNTRCYEVAKILKPSEAVKWMMYYKLTKDHPEHIMKDPRSKEAAQQRDKKLMHNRDPMGLYSGPRFDMQQGPSKQRENDDLGASGLGADEVEENSASGTGISSWDKVRLQNGMKESSSGSGGSAWSKVRHQQQQEQPSSVNNPVNPFTTNVYKPDTSQRSVAKDGSEEDQNEFDKLLEKERNIGEEEEKAGKW